MLDTDTTGADVVAVTLASVVDGAISVGDVADATSFVVSVVSLVVRAALLKPGRKLGVTVSVPVYRGQPGTLFGGARPPPQSTNSQSSPVPGTYQTRLGPTVDETQPLRSVRALASSGKRKIAVWIDSRRILQLKTLVYVIELKVECKI